MALALPVSRYRSSVTAQVPPGYPLNYLSIVRPSGAAVAVNGLFVAGELFTDVGASEMQLAWLQVAPGVHTVTATSPVGVTVHGYGDKVAYAHPAAVAGE
jgi:hypothetical protein